MTVRHASILALWFAMLMLSPAGTATERPSAPKPVNAATPDAACLDCHGNKGFAAPQGESGDSRKRALHVDLGVLRDSVHAKETCVACHTDIDQIPHRAPQTSYGADVATSIKHRVDCVGCHARKGEEAMALQVQNSMALVLAGLPVEAVPRSKVEQETARYLGSIHAQPRKDDPSRRNAACWDCHGKHDVFPMASRQAEVYRLSSPQTCGACHEKALKEYTNSAHGAKVKREGKLDSAVCSDCHSAHKIASIKEDPAKLAITTQCGSCHEKELKSYRDTYHGQVTRLGYAHTAKCADCHGSHNILPSKNPAAPTHPDHRLQTCSDECHKTATAGFISFEPHGNTHDYQRFPALWLASKFMIALLAGVFLLFWSHSALWFYREYQERKTGKVQVRLDQHGATAAQPQYVQRFSWQWRLAHLLLALAVMTLVLTGTTVLYADSFWAPTLIKLLGGPKVAAIMHRVAAATFGLLFFGHIGVVLHRIVVADKGRFDWFGPDSLLPNRQDGRDFIAMLRWFFAKGPRPVFGRWTYWEKFDYWAPFWGMFIIGLSGLTLWFPVFFGRFLPGWVFNVATLVHGEEAFLAAVFLFTVHFFNCHFRPEKLPLDVVMFTGSMTLQEFQHERPLEYQRLLAEGRLEQCLVGAPTPRMARYSRILGLCLIAIGLGLLLLVLLGFVQNLAM
ncbi:MAG: cytochrome C [Methylococcaceae bacterium]|nr:MAG: cytochrome C [Methylococcaceae bacterium]